MTHLGERIIDFIFDELPPAEMLEAQRHIVQCEDCRLQVEQFHHTRSMLKESPATEPPRRIVFEVEKPRRIISWRWGAVLAAAAAIALVVFMAAPIQVQRNGSQLTIAFGGVPQTAPPGTTIATQPQSPAAVQSIDYDRIIREVREINAGQQASLANELRKRDAALVHDVQRLQGELVYIDSVQRSMLRDTIENASSIQLLAQKNE